MAFISSPSIIQIRNAVDGVVVPVARILQFTGNIVVTQVGSGKAQIDGVGGPTTGAWDVAGNGGPGLHLGTTTPDLFSFVSNNIEVGGFDDDGNMFVSSPSGEAKNFLSLIVDPTVSPGVAAPLGTFAMSRIGATAAAYQKTGAGDQDWTQFSASSGGVSSLNSFTGAVSIAAGANISVTDIGNVITIAATGSAPTGSANSIPFYDNVAAYQTNTNFQLSDNFSMKLGTIAGTGSVSPSTGTSSLVFGTALNASTITLGAGSFGGMAFGYAQTSGSITANNKASVAGGFAQTSGSILANAEGSFAFGWVQSVGSTLSAVGQGNVAFGSASNGGILTSSGAGSLAIGVADNGHITSGTSGSITGGYSLGAGSLISSTGAFGGLAFGFASSGGQLISANGGFAFGHVALGSITANALGAFACGYVTTAGNSATVTGSGSFIGGGQDSALGTTHTVSGIRSISYGSTNLLSASLAQTFGHGLSNQSFASLHIGRFSVASGTAGAWVSTEPLFVIGNGANNGARANAYQIDKDGRQTTTASHVNKASRVVAAAAAIDARTDYRVIYDLAGASGNLTLPAGEDGLEFIFSPRGAGVAVYTLVPNGGDVLDVNIVAALSTAPARIAFFGGTWYAS